MKIGERIKEKRKEKGWTQREMAAKMGYTHHSTLARIEAGQVDVSQTRIVQFAEVLGVSVGYLMGWVDEEAEKKNDILADIVVRLRTDDDFLSVVETLYKCDSDKLNGVSQMLNAFLK